MHASVTLQSSWLLVLRSAHHQLLTRWCVRCQLPRRFNMKPRLSAQHSSSYANICNHMKQVISLATSTLTPQRQTNDACIKEEPSAFKMLHFGSDGHRKLWWCLKIITQYEVAQGNHHTQSKVRKRKKEHLVKRVCWKVSLYNSVRLVTDFCEHASSHAESHEQALLFLFFYRTCLGCDLFMAFAQ